MNVYLAVLIINLALIAGAVYLAINGWPWLAVLMLLCFVGTSGDKKDDE